MKQHAELDTLVIGGGVVCISVAYGLNLGSMLRVAAEYPPNVAAYFERMKARPAFQAAAAHA